LAGRVDPGGARGAQPNRNDQTLILATWPARRSTRCNDTVRELLLEAHGADDAERLATLLSHGR